MNYANDTYSWFESPEFLKNQETLLKRNDLLKNAIRENEAFNIDTVFDADKHLENQNLKVPNLTGKDQFSAFAQNNPIPKNLFGAEKATDPTAATSNMLGTQGVGEASSIASFGMDAIKSLSSTSANEGESITNGLNLTMKGAQAGMSVAGPPGAVVGAAVGFGVGVYDGFADAGKRGREERGANKKETEANHTKLEQEQRQKDGLDSLTKLSALRKQQEAFIV